MISIIITFVEMIPEFHILCPQCTLLHTFVYTSTVEMIPEFHILCPQCTILYTFVYISTVEMIPLALHAEKRHVTPRPLAA